jgi:hypothetical protein
METLTCYRVGEQLFTNKEVALLYETIKTMPNATQLSINSKNNVSLTLDLSESHLGVLIDKDGNTISFANIPICMTSEHFLELSKRGISWLVEGNIQNFAFSNKENLVEDFLFLYEHAKKVDSEIYKHKTGVL